MNITPAASPAALPDSGRFVALDAWRGLAALGVALYHIRGGAGLPGTLWHETLYLMVDFFFVLSGFVIASAYGARLAQGFPLTKFMWLRLGRIYPLHLAMVLAYVVLEIGAVMLVSGSSTGREPFTGPRDPGALPSALLLVQAFTHPNQDIWNAQSWTISVELWLYLAAAVGWRALGPRAPRVALAAALLALFALAWYAPWAERYSWLLRGIGGFGLGMALWPLHRRLVARAAAMQRRLATLAELAAIALVVLAQLHPFGPVLFTPACALAVLVFAQERGQVSRLLHAAPFVFLGTISYSLYLTHGLVMGRLFDLLGAVQGPLGRELVAAHLMESDLLLGSGWQQTLLAALVLAALIPAAWLSWRWLEEPARRWSRRTAARWGAGAEERAAPTI